MDKKDVLAKVMEKCPNMKIGCLEARQLAEELQIDSRELGRICNEAGVKIIACELGCF
ncbi:MAG: hypothetical protein ABFD04_12820 [Syntrophomonas sp.]